MSIQLLKKNIYILNEVVCIKNKDAVTESHLGKTYTSAITLVKKQRQNNDDSLSKQTEFEYQI